MSDGLVAARFSDLHAINSGLQGAMGQHEQSLDDQRRQALTSVDFWQGQNNQDMYADVMQQHKVVTEDIGRGRRQGQGAGNTAEDMNDCVTQCSALFT